MLTVLVLSTLLQAGKVNFGGVLPLSQVAASLASAGGEAVAVNSDCAPELLAVNFVDMTESEALGAIGSTGRYKVTKLDNAWKIGRDPDDENAESSARLRYIRAVVADTRRTADILAQGAYNLADPTKNPDTVLKAAESKKSPDAPETTAYGSLYLFYSHETPYFSMTLPAAKVGSLRESIDTTWFSTTVTAAPNLISRNGDIYNDTYFKAMFGPRTSRQQMRAVLSSMRLGGKCSFDPATRSVSMRLVADGRIQGQVFRALIKDMPLCNSSPDAPLKGIDLDVLKARMTETNAALANDKATASADMPAGSLGFSYALYSCAKSQKANLVAAVGTFTDRTVQAGSASSFQKLIDMANHGHYDAASETRRKLERRITTPVNNSALLTAKWDKGTFIVRDEQYFLKGFAERSPEPDAIALHAEEIGTLDARQMVEFVSKLPLISWRSSTYSERFLPWCNPITLYPFAKLLAGDAPMETTWVGLADGSSATTTLEKLSATDKAAFYNALKVASSLYDGQGESIPVDPVFAADEVAAAKPSEVLFTAQRQGSRLLFSIGVAGTPIWSSTIWLSKS